MDRKGKRKARKTSGGGRDGDGEEEGGPDLEELARQFREIEAEMEGQTRAVDVVQVWRERLQLYGADPNHTCESGACVLECLDRKNMVYGCPRSGVVHRCGADCGRGIVDNDSTLVCELTQLCFHQHMVAHIYENTARGTSGQNVGLKKEYHQFRDSVAHHPRGVDFDLRLQTPDVLLEQLQAHKKSAPPLYAFMQVVYQLLFSPTRARVERRKRRDIQTSCRSRLRKYVKKCTSSDIVPGWHSMQCIKWTIYKSAHRQMPILPYEPDRTAYYSRMIDVLWDHLGRTEYFKNPVHCIDRTVFAIGALYMLGKEKRVDHVTLFSGDYFLTYMLPPVLDHPKYGYKVGAITLGQNHINHGLQDYKRSFGIEEIKNAIQSVQ